MKNPDFKTGSIIGILGGMGPEATLECFESVINQTPASTDQEHLHVIVENNPKIPDRTEAILNDGEDPVPMLKSSARRLEKAGADLIIIPCNTAHYFIDKITEVIDIPIINMIETTIAKLPSPSKAGLLATNGTIETGIYEKYVPSGVEIKYPDKEYQQIVMKGIYGKEGIKSGCKGTELKRSFLRVVDHLREKGANTIIAGCTEIRLVLTSSDLEDMNLLTPIDLVAKKAVGRAR
jgi:aspartate racemase